jgi:vancomycin resistance protein YoaR
VVLPEVMTQTDLPIRIKTNQGFREFAAEDLGIEFNLASTIQAAHKNPFSHLWSFVAPINLEPKIDIDPDKFINSLTPIAQSLTVDARDAQLKITAGEIVILPQVTGKEINWERSIDNVRRSWLQREQSVNLVVNSQIPKITDEIIQTLSKQVAELIAQPIEVLVIDDSYIFNSLELGEVLQINKINDEPQVSIRPFELWSLFKQKYPSLSDPTTDAYFEIVDEVPVVQAGNIQVNITPMVFAQEFEKTLFNGTDKIVDLTSYAVTPNLTTQEAQNLNILEKVSEFRQPFPPAEYRTINVGTAAAYIDGKVLKPGEIFSMNDTIKQRTVENGYVTGIRIENGRFIEDLGGGVSIITTAMWTAAFYASLEAIEQRAHSIWIPRYQEGIEATVMWGSLDLKFKNTLDGGLLSKTKVEPNGVVISMYGKKKYDQVVAEVSNRYGVTPYKKVYSESKNCLAQEGQPGFGVKVTRKMIKNDQVVNQDEFRTNYRVGNEVICGPKPEKKKKPTEPVAETELITAGE